MSNMELKGIGRIMARYWNHNGISIAVVAVLRDYSLAGKNIIDWCAYIGASKCSSEQDTIDEVIKSGAKLLEHDARHFFPDLDSMPYRE